MVAVADLAGREVGFLADDGPIPGVEAEEGAAGQAGGGVGGQEGCIQGVDKRPEFGGQGGGDDVADFVVGLGGDKTGLGDHAPEFLVLGNAAELHIAAGGDVNVAVAEFGGDAGNVGPLLGSDVAAGEADPPDGAVGGVVEFECTWADVASGAVWG